jgi:hypothetical protein
MPEPAMNFIAMRRAQNWSIVIFHNQDVPSLERAKVFADLWKQ